MPYCCLLHLAAARDAADGRRELPVRGLNPVGALPRYQVVGAQREAARHGLPPPKEPAEAGH